MADGRRLIRRQIVEEARTWIGTAWHNNQCLKGEGCDCVNLPYSVYKAVGFNLPPLENYNRHPYGEKLLNRLDNYGTIIGVVKDRWQWSDRYLPYAMNHDALLEIIQPGDILVHARDYGGAPGHLAIRTDKGKIEADYEEGVVETSLDRELTLLGAYSFF